MGFRLDRKATVIRLILQAENNFDSSGFAFLDGFSDAISAFIEGGFDGDIEIPSIQEFES